MVSFPHVSPPEPCTHLSPPPYAPHDPPISFFSMIFCWYQSCLELRQILPFLLASIIHQISPKVIFSSFSVDVRPFYVLNAMEVSQYKNFRIPVSVDRTSVLRVCFIHVPSPFFVTFVIKKMFSSSELRVWNIGGMMLTGETKRNLSHSQFIYRGLLWVRSGLCVFTRPSPADQTPYYM